MLTWIYDTIGTSEIQLRCSKRTFHRALSGQFKKFLQENRQLVLKTSRHPDLAILLVTYNQAEFTYGCLSSIAASLIDSSLKYEIIILDNRSVDQTNELFNRVSGINVFRSNENLNYLRGVNRASEKASATHLLFLNNDTQIFPGTLKSALGTIESAPNTGAVGARTLWPNGRLQEAGGIVWNDGSSDHYGREDIPTAPQYMFLRPVDYCSGSFLLTPRELFHQMGRFDEIYSPGVYEDTDYCFRLGRKGYLTLYDPDAVVMHFEHASINEAETFELKQKNRNIFFNRHRDILAKQFSRAKDNELMARTAHAPKRLLVISGHSPKAMSNSPFANMRQILCELAEKGLEVTVLPAIAIPEDWIAIRRIWPKCIEVIPGVINLKTFLDPRRDFYDGIWIADTHNADFFFNWIDENHNRDGKSKLISYDPAQTTAAQMLAIL